MYRLKKRVALLPLLRKLLRRLLRLRPLLRLRLRRLLRLRLQNRLLLVLPLFPPRCLAKFWKLKLRLATLSNPAMS
jgi:hypothetical protein